jgi:hypothetical protein
MEHAPNTRHFITIVIKHAYPRLTWRATAGTGILIVRYLHLFVIRCDRADCLCSRAFAGNLCLPIPWADTAP